MTEGSDSPISETLASAMQMHELMVTWIEAGFTPDQAFRMVLEVLRGGMDRGLGGD